MYADPALRGKVREAANKYERILEEDGTSLPQNQQEGLKLVVQQLRQLADRKHLREGAFTEFRKLRESATTLCALPTCGEPRRTSSGYLSAGRVGGFAGRA